jgi:hypothetical protein
MRASKLQHYIEGSKKIAAGILRDTALGNIKEIEYDYALLERLKLTASEDLSPDHLASYHVFLKTLHTNVVV